MAKAKKVECACYQFPLDTDSSKHGIRPVFKTKEAACADVATPVAITIPAHSAIKSDLFIGFEIPKGYKIVMYPRSSLLIKKCLIQPVSIIDSDYSGQHVHVPLFNPTDKDIVLEAGERVCQIECVPAYDCDDWAHENAERMGGFGSTDK